MSFLGHLEVFRWHLVRSVAVLLVCTIVVFFLKDEVFNYVILPPSHGDFWTYQQLCKLSQLFGADSNLCDAKLPFKIISTKMSGQFAMHIWVSLVMGVIAASPYIFWEIWRFVKPGLTKIERKKSRGMIFYVTLLFLMGVAFGYFIVGPMSIMFLGTYQVSEVIQNTFHLSSYISTMTSVVIASSILFQIPVFIYFLTSIGLLSSEFLKTYRKHAIVVIFILSAVITPPDVTSQILISIPILGLYQMGIWIAKRIEKKQAKHENQNG